MSFDLTGIENVNEFYSQHYLSAILENDLKDLFKQWASDPDQKSPHQRLRGLYRSYFQLRNLAESERPSREDDFFTQRREIFFELLHAMGYEPSLQLHFLDGVEQQQPLPLLASLQLPNEDPLLWCIECPAASGDDDLDPLSQTLHGYPFPEDLSPNADFLQETLDDVITKRIFALDEPPRWIILLGDTQIVLVERGKWAEKRMLRFDLEDILGRREDSTLKAAAALLHRESIQPDEGVSLLDTIDENSHKHAFAVSEDLKEALRISIQLIGNEALHYIDEHLSKTPYELLGLDDGDDAALAAQLSRECLRYMYRVLFLFYIEARPELGYAPVDSETYLRGYSLETLRDLEMTQLISEEARNGYFIFESIKLLFDTIYQGFEPARKASSADEDGEQEALYGVFQLSPLQCHLFDPARAPLLSHVRFRNAIMLQIIERMSLSAPDGKRKKGRKKSKNRRGRISYAQLGINQLGAVYEALLSYSGFFAQDDLYEVKKAGEAYDPLHQAYFVKEHELEQYKEDERVFNDDGSFKMHPKGTFLYRLAGRDREKSASFYTPEVLTKCLVKYALKELLQGKSADDILDLTICEPAMGSAAFLNEAVEQLAEAYLERKQKETGERIAHDEYVHHKQRVKMHITDRNVYGVDLNPVAVELAEVSLWLNSIHKGALVPWFRFQLYTGNSLIGARRQFFREKYLKRDAKGKLWLDEVPERAEPGKKRTPRSKSVYHFLLPDTGMALYKDKDIKAIEGDNLKRMDKWRKEFCKLPSEDDVERLVELSDTIDRLWELHTKHLRDLHQKTEDEIPVWPDLQPPRQIHSTAEKDKIYRQIQSRHESEFDKNKENKVRNASPFERLKLVMDYWCALWFWPIELADKLPTWDLFMMQISAILEGNVFDMGIKSGQTMDMFGQRTEAQTDFLDKLENREYVNIDTLCETFEQLRIVRDLADKYRFHHWELVFADIFADRGGFDLILGNPPWRKVQWQEGGVMGDANPLFVLRKFSASKLAKMRKELLGDNPELKKTYLAEYQEAQGTRNFFSGLQNYPLLKGVQSNLYKCFLPLAWSIGADGGVNAFVHPEGVYDDPKGSELRRCVYSRLCMHFQFQNEFQLFEGTNDHGRMRFGLHVYGNKVLEKISFNSINNLFLPATVDLSFSHHGKGPVPGIKDDHNKWNVAGHADRIGCN